MQVEQTQIKDLLVLTPKVHKDHRGFFLESFREDIFQELNLPKFIQDNQSFSSTAGVFRGMHFQKNPTAQSKLVWVTTGAVLDIVLDIRTNSTTYGQYHVEILSAENFKRLFVPQGFAHGFLVLEPNTNFHYKVDNYYSAKDEGGISNQTPEVQSLLKQYYKEELILSEKDSLLPLFTDFISPF